MVPTSSITAASYPPATVFPHDTSMKPHPSAEVHLVAAQIISSLSEQIYSERSLPQPIKLGLEKQDRESIREQWLENWDPLAYGRAAGKFYPIGNGDNTVAFSHRDYPHLVFKKMSCSSAQLQKKASRRGISETILKTNAFFLRFPVGTSIRLNNKWREPMSLYAEQRLPLELSAEQNEELIDRLVSFFETSASETFQTNLKEIVTQTARLIVELGYFDVGPHNGPIFNPQNSQELFFFDFDGIFPEAESILSNGKKGILALIEMFPIPSLAQAVQEVCANHGLVDEEFLFKFKTRLVDSALKFKARTEALHA